MAGTQQTRAQLLQLAALKLPDAPFTGIYPTDVRAIINALILASLNLADDVPISSGGTGTGTGTGTIGPAGATGATGQAGIQGIQGIQGLQGVRGLAGLAGTAGTVGATGLTGAAGTQGVIGATGPTGTSGVAGAAGANGITGATGAAGAIGAAGANGTSVTIQGSVASSGNLPTGLSASQSGYGYLTNDTGHLWVWSGSAFTDVGTIRGPVGLTGTTGTAGTNGTAGATGLAGATGTTGAAGPAGAAGVQGSTGLSGAAGDPGSTGTAGAAGAPGATGLTGPTGATGNQGATGSAGATGAAGAIGPTGTTGAQGPIGVTGVTGTNGTNGATGPTGATGVTGPAGTGTTLYSGTGYATDGAMTQAATTNLVGDLTRFQNRTGYHTPFTTNSFSNPYATKAISFSNQIYKNLFYKAGDRLRFQSVTAIQDGTVTSYNAATGDLNFTFDNNFDTITGPFTLAYVPAVASPATKLYSTTGPNTDGAMTQAAVTAALPTAIAVTYAQLTAALTGAGTLLVGQWYTLSDYRTTHTIPNTASIVNTGPLEPLLLLATAANKLAPSGYSTVYPEDVIYYTPDNSDPRLPGATTGFVCRRFDTKRRNDIEVDFRVVKFRRWETASGSGIFTVVSDNGFAFQDGNLFHPTAYAAGNVTANLWSGFPATSSALGIVNTVMSATSFVYNNTLIGSAFGPNTLLDTSRVYNNTLTLNSNFGNNILFSNSSVYGNSLINSTISGNTLTGSNAIGTSGIYFNTAFNSTIFGNSLTSSEIKYNTLTNVSSLSNNIMSGKSLISFNTLNNNSIISTNTLQTTSTITTNTLINSTFSNKTLTSTNINSTYYLSGTRTDGAIDYTNPVVISGPATLAIAHAHRITGAGYALALPDPAVNIGGCLFVNVVAAAGGLYPITGTSFVLQAQETLEAIATVDGWKRIGGEIVKTSIRAITDTSTTTNLATNSNTITPLVITQRSTGQISLANQGILIARKASATIESAIILQGVTVGQFYQAAIVQTNAAGVSTVVAIGLIPNAAPGETYGMLSMSAKVQAQAGDSFQTGISCGNGGGKFRTDAPSQPNTLTYTED